MHGDLVGGIQDLTNAINVSVKFSAQLYINRADMYVGMKHLNEAISDYDEVLKNEPHLYFIYYNRGKLKSIQQDFIGAIEDFSKAIYRDQGWADAYIERAKNKLKIGLEESAQKDFNHALELNQ
jgi:tetratricopeptide (TPR) repeat protein